MLCFSALFLLAIVNHIVEASNYTTFAETAFNVLQGYYDEGTGLWDTCGWWNGANCLTAVVDLAAVDASILATATSVIGHTYTQAPAFNPNGAVTKRAEPGHIETRYSIPFAKDIRARQAASAGFEDTCADDNGWWALAWIAAYDLTADAAYLETAQGIFANMQGGGPTTCNSGGIYWCRGVTYVNAIANELYLSVAAHLAVRTTNGSDYFTIALDQWTWFYHSNMILDNLINDGLLADCSNNGAQIWSYNQGVILGALVEMYRYDSGNTSYLDSANTLAAASIANLTDANHVLHEWACEPDCAPDGTQFKGIYARNLLALYKMTALESYAQVLTASADSLWNNDRDADNNLSVEWQGPFEPNANASTQSSALDALVAAIVVAN